MLLLKIILSVLFLIAGVAKLFRAKPLQDQFIEFGLPNIAIVIVGSLEIMGAIGLQIPSISPWAEFGLCALMLGAIYHHIRIGHTIDKLMPSLLLLIIMIIDLTVMLFST